MTDENKGFKLVITKGAFTGTAYELESGENIIGRWDPESGSIPDINLEKEDVEAKISRQHAMVIVNGDQVTVEDMGSLNGTQVNHSDLRVGMRCLMHPKDELIIGKVFMELEKA